MSLPTPDLDESFESPVSSQGDDHTIDTFNFTTYDDSNSLGALMSMNSIPGDPTMWRECLMVFHPSGDLLLGRGFGRNPKHPGGSNLSFTCLEPFKRWALRFDGFLMRAPSSAVAGTRLSDHPEVPVSFDLEYESIMPAWGHAADGNVAGTHYEQNGLIRGRIRCAGETFDYDGIGFRDRIAGPKDTSLLAGHNWIHGTMRDGRAFALTQIRLKTDPEIPMGSACVVENGHVHPAEVVQASMWDGTGTGPKGLDIVLKSDLGETALRMDPVRSVPWMYVVSKYVGLQPALFGHDESWPGALLLWESAARLTWGNDIGFGHIEQSIVKT